MQETARGENQLRGRAGRQGDPGESLALFDLEDRLLAEAGVVAQVNALLGPSLAGARVRGAALSPLGRHPKACLPANSRRVVLSRLPRAAALCWGAAQGPRARGARVSDRGARPAARPGAKFGARLTARAARAADEELVIEGAIARALVIGVLQRSLEEASRSGRQSLAECAPAAQPVQPTTLQCCTLARARLDTGRRGRRGLARRIRGPPRPPDGHRAAPARAPRRHRGARARAGSTRSWTCSGSTCSRCAGAWSRTSAPRAAACCTRTCWRAPWGAPALPHVPLLCGDLGACVCAACGAQLTGRARSGRGCGPGCARWSAGLGDSGSL